MRFSSRYPGKRGRDLSGRGSHAQSSQGEDGLPSGFTSWQVPARVSAGASIPGVGGWDLGQAEQAPGA